MVYFCLPLKERFYKTIQQGSSILRNIVWKFKEIKYKLPKEVALKESITPFKSEISKIYLLHLRI